MAQKIQEEIGMNKKKETAIFLLKLLVLSIPLYIFMWIGIDLSFLQEITTNSVISSLRLLGIETSREGFNISAQGFLFHISPDCTGWKGMLFLFSLIMSTKSNWGKKIIGIFATIPSFFSFNVLRILLMVQIGLGDTRTFELLHDFLWQFSMVAVVLLLWLIWARSDINILGVKK